MPRKPRKDAEILFNQKGILAATRGIVIAGDQDDATHLIVHDVAATTFNGRDEAIHSAHKPFFRDKPVYVLANGNDRSVAHAAHLAAFLNTTASVLKIVTLDKSVLGYFEAGGDVKTLSKLIGDAPEYAPPPPKPPRPPLDPDSWRSTLIYNDDGKLTATVNNAQLLLAYDDDVARVFAHNRFALSVDVMRRPPWDTEPAITYPRPLSDVDDTRACAWLERHGVKLTIGTTHNAIVSAAFHQPYNPLTEWLDGLKWDQRPRLDAALADFFGCDNNEYTQGVSSKFLIGSVARAFDPGCKMDTMLILEGRQGLLKSTAIETLFGAEFFSDELADIGSKDAALQMQGVWCIEVQELATMYRAESNRLKEWLSRRVDRFRPPYGRNVIQAKRQCVFVGSVNPEGGYLKDATGSRRFWPVRCHDIDIPLIRRERDQVWAEAVHRYRQGDRWWFSAEEYAIVKDEQAERYESDPWADDVEHIVHGKQWVAVSDVLRSLDLPAHQRTQLAQTRVAKILTAMGWERRQKRDGGRRRWVYVAVADAD